MPNPEMSGAAALALKSLQEHPHLTTAAAINNGPFGIEQIEESETLAGLQELEALGLARRDAGGWHYSGPTED